MYLKFYVKLLINAHIKRVNKINKIVIIKLHIVGIHKLIAFLK